MESRWRRSEAEAAKFAGTEAEDEHLRLHRGLSSAAGHLYILLHNLLVDM